MTSTERVVSQRLATRSYAISPSSTYSIGFAQNAAPVSSPTESSTNAPNSNASRVTPIHKVTAMLSARGAAGVRRSSARATIQIAATMATTRSSMRTGIYVPETPTSAIFG